jgi:hypothetical protein
VHTEFPDIIGADVIVSSLTAIICTFYLVGALAGSYDVVVTNPDGQSGTLPAGFTVFSPPTKIEIFPTSGTWYCWY